MSALSHRLLLCWLFSFSLLSAASLRIVLPPDAAPRVHYGAEQLSAALRAAGHQVHGSNDSASVDLEILTAPLSQPGKLSSLVPTVPLRAEGFRIKSLGASQLGLLGADDSGLLYGLLELSSRLGANSLPTAAIDFTDAPALRLRGPCIGMQKTYILPGYHVYEYPYREDLFPFFYDRAGWLRYLDFLAANRMNSLYLWNGHPFASLVRLPKYPYALEVSEEQFARNVEMFRFIAREADRRGIWVVQMFYSIILSKPFAEKHGLSTQLAAPVPVANDYMRESIAAFVRDYPNVGLMVCLGEALQGIDNQVSWCNDVVLAGVKEGMKAAGLTREPPVVIRTHATDPRVVMPAALKNYGNLYTEAKFNGESLTTWEPRGTWQKIHQDMSKLGSTHIANVHILANLEPFRYGAQQFIRKSVLAMRDRLGAGGLHLYPLAYWNWPDSPDITPSPLPQIDRDWIWYEAWARYAWNPDVDEASDRAYWLGRLTQKFGTPEAAAALLDAYNFSGECAPRLLRRFGITEGNRQTLSLGMTLDQLVTPERFRPYPELWESQAPVGERLNEFVDKEWNHIAHVGETPSRVIAEVLDFSDRAVAAAAAAAPHVTRNQEEFSRVRNDMLCIQAMSRSYASKARAAIHVLRFNHSEDPADMELAERYLAESLEHYRSLVALTRDTYHFANTMQTSQRRIPVSGGSDGKPANYHWTQLLPTYERELAEFRLRVASLRSGASKPSKTPVAVLRKAALRLLSPGAELYSPMPGSRVFTDKPWEVQSLAPELNGLTGIRFPYTSAAAGKYSPVEFECEQAVNVLVGYVQSSDPAWLKVPQLETDALAGENFVSEALIQNAAAIDTLPAVNVHIHRFPAGRNRLEVRGSGAFIVLGVCLAESESASATRPQPVPVSAPSQTSASPGASATPAPLPAPVQAKPVSQARYRVSVCDWMILKRQKLGAFQLAAEIGADGVELDIGGLGTRETWDNKLVDPTILQQFRDKASSLGLSVSSISMSGFYAQSFAERPNYQQLIADCITLMQGFGVKVAFLPLGVKGDLLKHPELRPTIIERLKAVAPMAEKAGVVIGIETALNATEEARLLDEVGSPAIKSYFNFANALQNGRDLYAELKTLGAQRIAQIHCTDQDGVWLQDNPRIDMKRVKALLDELKWSGWLVIERSRDAKDPKNVRRNFGANAAYLKAVFQP